MSSNGKTKKKKGEKKVSSIPKGPKNNPKKLEFFTFLNEYSTSEQAGDKKNYNKVKLTSIDKFNECLLEICQKIKKGKESTPFLFTGTIDGVDEILSSYANIALSFSKDEIKKVYGIFVDRDPQKIMYFIFRLFLTLVSKDNLAYLRNLFFFDIEGKKDLELIRLLESAHRDNPSPEQHKNYLRHLLKSLDQYQQDNLKSYMDKGVDVLSLLKDKARNYKNLAKLLKANVLLNPETHWLSSDERFQVVKEACMSNLIKVFKADLNGGGQIQLMKILKESGLTTNIIYAPKASKKFSEASDLIKLFDMFIDSRPPSEKSKNYRVWHIVEPERFFTKPTFAHQGELSSEQLMELVQGYKARTSIYSDVDESVNVLLLGDIPFGRLYMDERSTTFLKNLQKYVNLRKVPRVILCGDVLDGEHTREKRKLAFLQYLTDAPAPALEQQCDLAKNYLSRFNADLLSVISDGDWDIIEEKQREITNQKEFDYKIENNTKHIPDYVKKSLRIESMFEAAKEYFEYFESKIHLSKKMGDTLQLKFNNCFMQISHMNIGQYFRRSLARAVGVKEQMIMNQLGAIKSIPVSEELSIKVSSHDNVLHAAMENESTLNLRVPSLESPDKYQELPIQMRNAVQDMMHKAVAVRGKIPFPGSCHVQVTKDHRILLTILNERIIEMIKQHQHLKTKKEYIIYDMADCQIGSIAYSYKTLIKYLDYVKFQSSKLCEKPNISAKRIALLNGDIIEGINYPTAMMRNASTKLTFPQTQISYATEVLKPFFFNKKSGGYRIDPDIDKIILTHGNHEWNSGFRDSGLTAIHSLYQYFKGGIEHDLDFKDTRQKLTYSLFTQLDKDKLIMSSIGAFNCLGLNGYLIHSYGGGVNVASTSPPQEKWVSKIGPLAKKWDILIQGHYHKFSLGECAGKLLLTFPSFTTISDFEYERGLYPPESRVVLHISSTEGVTVEILTKKFLQNYQCQHPLFQKMTMEKFHDQCTERALQPVDLTEFS